MTAQWTGSVLPLPVPRDHLSSVEPILDSTVSFLFNL